jgi:hypothetical protein
MWKTSTDKVIAKFLKHQSKDKTILIKMDNKWHRATQCHAKSKSGVRLKRFFRLRTVINKI